MTRYHLHYHRAAELKDTTLLKTLESLDAFRRPQRFEQFLLACEADSRGRPGYEERVFDQPRIYREAFAAANAIEATPFVDQGLQGKDIAEAMHRARLTAVSQVRRGDQ